MTAILEKQQLIAKIWQLAQELTLPEKLALSEQLMADVRQQLITTDWAANQTGVGITTSEKTVDESDEWSEQDLAELRKTSLHYADSSLWMEGQDDD